MHMYRLTLLLTALGYFFLPWTNLAWGSSNWYQPFIFWLVLIGLTLGLEQKRRLEQLS